MKVQRCILILAAALLAACAPQPPADEAGPTAAPPPTGPPPTAEQVTPAEAPPATPARPGFEGSPLPSEVGDLFSASGACASCHSNMVDEAGNDVSVGEWWRSTMMANAARDPYWVASVRAETLAHPALDAVIQDKCATCHMPMARSTAAAAGETGVVLDDGCLNPDHPLHTLAMDGVSCTLCHQIEPDNFGTAEGFSGGYAIDLDLPTGERVNYGQFEVEAAQATLMQSASGFIPVQGLHIQQAEMCATCHTLYTPYVDAAGQVAGEFPEQMPYAEWLASDHAGTQTCQACHMPPAEGGVQLSATGGPPRSPFGTHAFVGGNSTVLGILRASGEAMGVTASSEDFDATIARMRGRMQSQAATVVLENVTLSGSQLAADVVIATLTGHKFPTGFPSRRVWLHVLVSDASGSVIFESGGVDAAGRIAGNDNDDDPLAFEPHYTTLSSPDQVQIYEAIMGDTDGSVTTTLLRGAAYLKDNRLLPAGFDPAAASPDIGVYGGAADDPDFTGGGDRVGIAVDVGSAQGPFTLVVELLYQSVGYRWAENLRATEAPEIGAFLGYYDAVPNEPVVAGYAVAEVGP